MATKFSENSASFFQCETCDYVCSRLQYWKQHCQTKKHKNAFGNNVANSVNKTIEQKYTCLCGKSYLDRSGLWKHKKHCKNDMMKPYKTITPEIIIDLIQQNKELQQTLIEQNKTIIQLSQKTGSNINCNNKTFNLQVFLNETCKDAINLSDFVNQMNISIQDLEETGKLGYAEGISKVFIDNLNNLDYPARPIHCSDFKREILYIKEDNKWNKDDNNKTTLTKAIKQVTGKNIKKITDWQKLHPDFSDPNSKCNDKYMQIVLNSMSGSTQEESTKNYEKIVKNIAKEVVINKN